MLVPLNSIIATPMAGIPAGPRRSVGFSSVCLESLASSSQDASVMFPAVCGLGPRFRARVQGFKVLGCMGKIPEEQRAA